MAANNNKNPWLNVDRVLDTPGLDWNSEYPYGLNTPSANVFLLASTHGAISNGGLRYSFEVEHPGNPNYDLICDVYRQIGAPVTARCIAQAAAAFPFSDPHLHEIERLTTMHGSEDDDTEYTDIEILFMRLNDEIFDEDPEDKFLQYMLANLADLPPNPETDQQP